MTGRQQLARLLPLALLLILASAGLHGETASPSWDGPLKAHGVVIGLILEAILAVLLVITLVRDAAARRAAETAPRAAETATRATETATVTESAGAGVPGGLRWVLKWVLGLGMAAVAVVLITNANLHLFTGAHPQEPPPARLAPPQAPPTIGKTAPSTFHIPLGPILYGPLIAALVAAVAVSIWWSARARPAQAGLPADITEDSEELRDAVADGRAAFAQLDDAREAIIACYLAMERSLADRGAARNAADTPDELLNRAVTSGIVRGPAASRLTGLFYEARFSSHPLGPEQRDAARQALDDMAAELASRADSQTASQANSRADSRAEPAP